MNRTDNKTVNALDSRQQKYGGMETPAAGAVTDIKGFSLVREQVLGLKLDKMSDRWGPGWRPAVPCRRAPLWGLGRSRRLIIVVGLGVIDLDWLRGTL